MSGLLKVGTRTPVRWFGGASRLEAGVIRQDARRAGLQ